VFAPNSGIPHPIDSLLAAVQWGFLSGGVLYALGVLWRLVRGIEAMGFGDVKLMAMVGGLLGHYGFLAIPLAATAGTVVFVLGGLIVALARYLVTRGEGGKFSLQMRVPFGPLLAIGTALMLFWGPLVMGVYVRLITPFGPVWLDYVCPFWDAARL
jgi:leader peptidase (prepilin peptidase)/N-methyltransferase